MTKVFVTRCVPEESLRALKTVAEVEVWPEEEMPVPREVLLERAKTADGLLTMISDQVDEELLSAANHLKVVANMAVGFDNIDVETASAKGIVVCNTPDVLTDTTADLTFILLMATARRILEAADFVKHDKWKNWAPMLLAGSDIHHKTLGIFGMGRIGAAVAKRASGFDMKVLYHNRSRNQNIEDTLGAEYVPFEELLSRSDFVVCLAPLTKETKGIFHEGAFQSMKRSAFFINASRGGLVVEEDLERALLNKEIAGAGLDVFEEEPISNKHPLLTHPNVVALPHIGSASVETRLHMVSLASQNIVDVLNGDKPKTILNPEIWRTES
ncbi:D-glycerate dehydrogenase [Salipaludibacillus neizhouensis]|uniref:D-glycerate dehydrogenase n=1 Tax=Salipaludibacillus neizhouensis TaxID=885475 RepID=A0A3A9JX39_9BACI|nr:D-glycerate dehydrogenase [Salipaludibacillus neizhouensis]RKL65464.1 D-glycerate dehydrogenase [Salipaludibacillus neizhouensis]